MTCSNKCWNKPLIELVHSFQVHVVRQPHILIYEVESSVSYELVQVTMIVLDDSVSSTRLTFPYSFKNANISFCKFYTVFLGGGETLSAFILFIIVMRLTKDLQCFHIIFYFLIWYLKIQQIEIANYLINDMCSRNYIDFFLILQEGSYQIL